MPKLLTFEIWGDYGHFRKPYTTTSPLSYAIPTRTALTGIIGAIIGVGKNKNNELFNYSKASFGIKLLSEVKKTIINQNFIDTKKAKYMSRIEPKGGRTQIHVEYIKEPKYKIYASLRDNELYEKLKQKLSEHEMVYTPCFGISECLANYEFSGEYDYEYKTAEGDILIDSVINLDNIEKINIEIEREKEYFTDALPMVMKEDREVTKYSDILYERKCGQIKCKNIEYIKVSNGENIVFY